MPARVQVALCLREAMLAVVGSLMQHAELDMHGVLLVLYTAGCHNCSLRVIYVSMGNHAKPTKGHQ